MHETRAAFVLALDQSGEKDQAELIVTRRGEARTRLASPISVLEIQLLWFPAILTH